MTILMVLKDIFNGNIKEIIDEDEVILVHIIVSFGIKF